jgi:polyphosphate kinase
MLLNDFCRGAVILARLMSGDASTLLTLAPKDFFNRELSWLEFNQRVLEEAMDPATPLLERVKFFCIFSSNLDEFFEVRVAGLKQQMESPVVERTPDGLTATENLRAVTAASANWSSANTNAGARICGPPWRKKASASSRLRNCPPATGLGWRIFIAPRCGRCSRRWGWTRRIRFRSCSTSRSTASCNWKSAEDGQLRQRLAVVQVPRVLPRLVKLPRPDSPEQDYFSSAS